MTASYCSSIEPSHDMSSLPLSVKDMLPEFLKACPRKMISGVPVRGTGFGKDIHNVKTSLRKSRRTMTIRRIAENPKGSKTDEKHEGALLLFRGAMPLDTWQQAQQRWNAAENIAKMQLKDDMYDCYVCHCDVTEQYIKGLNQCWEDIPHLLGHSISSGSSGLHVLLTKALHAFYMKYEVLPYMTIVIHMDCTIKTPIYFKPHSLNITHRWDYPPLQNTTPTGMPRINNVILGIPRSLIDLINDALLLMMHLPRSHPSSALAQHVSPENDILDYIPKYELHNVHLHMLSDYGGCSNPFLSYNEVYSMGGVNDCPNDSVRLP